MVNIKVKSSARRALGLLAAVCVLFMATIARGAETAPAVPASETSWYGWQILLLDVAAAGAYYGNAKTALFATSVAIYAGGGPLVRTLHDGSGVGSLLRRLAFPVAGGLLGLGLANATDARHSTTSNECGETCAGAIYMMLIGMGVGAGTAMIYDWFTAEDQVPVEPRPAVAWAPMVVVTPRVRAVSLVLRF